MGHAATVRPTPTQSALGKVSLDGTGGNGAPETIMEAEPESNCGSNALNFWYFIRHFECLSINRSIAAKFKMGSIPKAGIENGSPGPNHLAHGQTLRRVSGACVLKRRP